MKTQNLLMTVICLLCLGASSYAQPFEMAYHGTYGPPPGFPLYASDFQHYSIETTPGGDYVLAGTVLNSAVGNTDIHLLKIDPTGTILWEVNLDYMGFDDAALDVVVDPAGEIVLTGHVCNSPNFPEMYVAKYDPNGVFMADNIITGFPTAASSGTNIIYSSSTNHYIIGGFHADPPVMHPHVNAEAVLVEVDPALNPVTSSTFSFNGGPAYDSHASINDVLEIPGVGYFATGSYESSAGTPGVLAVTVDLGLNLMMDNSFNDGTYIDQRGVTAFYDAATDEIFLVSNHDATSNPQIRRLVGASGGGAIAQELEINLFDPITGAVIDASAFQLIDCPWNPSQMIMAGRFKFGNITGTGVDNNNWLLEVDKATLGLGASMMWDVTSPNYEAFAPTVMGPLFSTYVGPHPYMYNEEIVTNRNDLMGVVTVTPTDIASPNFGIDVVTTNNMAALGCYQALASFTNPTSHIPEPIMFNPWPVSPMSPNIMGGRSTGMDWNCHDPGLPRLPGTGGGSEVNEAGVSSIAENNGGTIGLNVSPNPSSNEFTIVLNGDNLDGTFTVSNAVGQIVYQSAQINGTTYTDRIDLSGFENGIYILRFTGNNQQIVKKLIKV